MSNSSKQLTLLDCATQKSSAKRVKLTLAEESPETLRSNKVCEDYSDEEGIHFNLMEMPSIPSPCCTPVVIYSSSDDDESVQADFVTDDDKSMHVDSLVTHHFSLHVTVLFPQHLV